MGNIGCVPGSRTRLPTKANFFAYQTPYSDREALVGRMPTANGLKSWCLNSDGQGSYPKYSPRLSKKVLTIYSRRPRGARGDRAGSAKCCLGE